MVSNFNRLLSGLGALVLASVVWGEGHIDSISAKDATQKGAAITIVGQNLSQPKVTIVGRYYILTFDAKMEGGNRHFDIDSDTADTARVTWFSHNPAKVRLSVHTDGHAHPTLQKSDAGWDVYFGDAKPLLAKKDESYPDSIPPLPNSPSITAAPTNNATTMVRKELSSTVTLDFVNTDVVQILKALAMQANVNIVTSPDVAGKLSVSLGSIPLGQAMDLITTMSGVRYTRVGNTYIVATPAKFSDMVQALGGQIDASVQTRVVPIYSHQGAQVKASVLKAVPVATLMGKYDLLLSSENLQVIQAQNLTPQGGTDLGGKGDEKGGSDGGSKPTSAAGIISSTQAPSTKQEDNYMVIVGSPARLDEVEQMARAIDTRICGAMGVKIPESNGVVQRSYEPHGATAEDLVAAMRTDKTYNFGDVQLYATPHTSFSRQVIVVSGRENDVDHMLQVLSSMDSLADTGPTNFEIVDLKFVRPQLAMVEVGDAVPGLRVKLLPSPVDPNTGMHYTDVRRGSNPVAGTNGGPNGQAPASNGGGAAPTSTGSGSGGSTSGGSASGGTSSGSSGTATGIASTPIQSAESVSEWVADTTSYSVPMKLLLRGSADQIAQAKAFLNMVDVEPKQVALELRVMELSNEDALSMGLNLSLLTGGSLAALNLNEAIGDGTTPGSIGSTLNFKGGGVLKALGALDSTANKNKLIARPSILASDGSLTHIFVGDEVRYIQSIQSTQNGVTVQTDRVDVGVDFYVTPRIGGDGNITLDLRPTFSILEGFTDVPGGGKLPQTSSRTASSIVNMKSGETIAIGGLITDQDIKNYSGIPILKDLPLIGRLFGRTSNDHVRKEVVFFITAKEVDHGNRGGAANPKQAEHDNNTWPGGGPHGSDKGNGHG